MNKRVSHEEFVRAWIGSKTLREVASKTGIAAEACSRRANFLRRRGVNLSKFKSKPPIDIAALNRLVEEAA